MDTQRICGECGMHDASYLCGNMICGVSYCSKDHQELHWHRNHRDVCLQSIRFVTDNVSTHIDSEVTKKAGNFFKNIVSTQEPPNDESDAAFEAAKKTIDPAQETAVEKTEKKWEQTHMAKFKKVLEQMKEVVAAGKDDSDPASIALKAVKAIEPAGDDASSSRGFVKKYFIKLVRAGFKVTFAGGTVAAGAAAESATVVGIPLDTLVDVVATGLDVLIFGATVMQSIYTLGSTFLDIKEGLFNLLTFEGGPDGVVTAVDTMFGVLEKAGLKDRAQQFIGSIIGLFDQFIRWGAPLIGSLIGMAIPYDASITGRVIEFFLYPIKFFITKGWLLLRALWDLLPQSWASIFTNKEKLDNLMLAFVDIIKRLFPVDKSDDWKKKLLEGARKVTTTGFKLHPLVIVGVIKKSTVETRLAKGAEKAKQVSDFIDIRVTKWLDNTVIPNIDKISSIIRACMGLGFGCVYMFYAYTPDGAKRKLGILPQIIGIDVDDLSNCLANNDKARQAFVQDTATRRHEVREIMCDIPTPKGYAYILMCIEKGVELDMDVRANSIMYRKTIVLQ